VIVDTAQWTGEGSFTASLVDTLKDLAGIGAVRVEDAPSSRTEPGYAFISNEVYVAFEPEPRVQITRRFGVPWRRTVQADRLTLEQLGEALGAVEGIGAPDYADEGMLQYLRTERIIPPYQTKGTKVIEMVRIYRAARA